MILMKASEKIRNEKVGCSIHLSGTNTANRNPLLETERVFCWASTCQRAVGSYTHLKPMYTA